jgi:cell division protein FtsB
MKKVVFIIVVAVLILIINNLIHSIYDIWSKQSLLTQAQKELTHQKSENQKLKTELSYVQTNGFVEEQARDKLFLVKPGEQDILIPSQISTQSAQNNQQAQTPNWQQWLNLFF